VVPERAKLVERIFRDYASGVSQRSLAQTLNAEGIPTVQGGRWLQSTISQMLGQSIYAGKIAGKDGELVDGSHTAIISQELWDRVQAIRTGALKRKPGRHASGQHLLVRGLLRCACGDSMLVRTPKSPSDGERYVCRARFEHGSCSMPRIRREAIDEPFLRTLLDSYIDLDATRKRIGERASEALTVAREALEQAEREAASAEVKLARVRSHYQAGRIEPEDWAEQRPSLTAELDAAREAVLRAQEHAQQTEQGGTPGDAEQALLDHLAALKQAVAAGVDEAPDLAALRNVIGQMFESVLVARAGEVPHLPDGDGMVWDVGNLPEGDGYVLWPVLRGAAVDDEWEAIRQTLPMPDAQDTLEQSNSFQQWPPSTATTLSSRSAVESCA
jgi:hypothetical protein